MLHSQTEMLKALRYMGAEAARIDIPMLHPDQMKLASIKLHELADGLECIAFGKGTNINKIFGARVIISMIQKDLRDYARGSIRWVREQEL